MSWRECVSVVLKRCGSPMERLVAATTMENEERHILTLACCQELVNHTGKVDLECALGEPAGSPRAFEYT
jgi:hypothetical protein